MKSSYFHTKSDFSITEIRLEWVSSGGDHQHITSAVRARVSPDLFGPRYSTRVVEKKARIAFWTSLILVFLNVPRDEFQF